MLPGVTAAPPKSNVTSASLEVDGRLTVTVFVLPMTGPLKAPSLGVREIVYVPAGFALYSSCTVARLEPGYEVT